VPGAFPLHVSLSKCGPAQTCTVFRRRRSARRLVRLHARSPAARSLACRALARDLPQWAGPLRRLRCLIALPGSIDRLPTRAGGRRLSAPQRPASLHLLCASAALSALSFF
jgi:hypothetical protein